MTPEDAHALAEFIKDHDKRFEAKAKQNGAESAVLLTLASDGTTLAPITATGQYQAAHIDGGDDPGPTVRAAWDKWRPALTKSSNEQGVR